MGVGARELTQQTGVVERSEAECREVAREEEEAGRETEEEEQGDEEQVEVEYSVSGLLPGILGLLRVS